MVKFKTRWGLFLLASVVLFACAEREVELKLEVRAVLDGNPAAQATVLVDGAEAGATDDTGTFMSALTRMPGSEVKVSVVKEAPGYRLKPWEGSFKVTKPEKGAVDTYQLEAVLEAGKYLTIRVTDKGAPLEGASVSIDGKKVAVTDATGEFVHEYSGAPGRKMKLKVAKKGYVNWVKTLKVKPGAVLEAAVFRPSVLTIVALREEYGQEIGLEGVEVTVGKKKLGKTDAKGTVRFVYWGAPGKTFRVKMSAPGQLPPVWSTKVALDGRRTLKHYFYPADPKPIRTGIYGYSGNVPDEDLTPILQRVEQAVGNILFSHMVFEEVPGDTLRERIKQAKTDIETMTTKGWRDTSLMGSADTVILGSVSRDNRGYIIETKVYTSDGRLVLSQINTARGERNIKDVAKKVVKNIMEQFPFQGALIAQKKDNYQINLGKSGYQLRRGMEFALMSPSMDRRGKVKGFNEVGTLRIRKVQNESSWAEVVEIKDGVTPRIGNRAFRRTVTEEEQRAAAQSFVLQAKGGVPPDVDPLPGVNVYLNEQWVGTTGSKGRTRIPVKVGRSYDLLLYRHGYQQWSGKVKADQDGEQKDYVLGINNSLLKVESQPSGAKVYVDGKMVGKTPMGGGKQVKFGFHTLKLTVGRDYRDWEEVVEFNRKEVDLTGPARINFVKDFIAIGKRAEQKGNMGSAMAAYSSPDKGHPDYSDARFRLAQLYMDERDDYSAAIREFENVLSLPENQQLIYKQFSVAYTNLGHAYYEMGNGMINEDKQGAAGNFAKAVENLERAKQYTRFFPTQFYNEALHDTHYYLALSYHKLYLITRRDTLLGKADFAWREYFDFFPKKLEDVGTFAQMRDSAGKYWTQIQDLM